MTQSMETATTVREALNFISGEWARLGQKHGFDVADPILQSEACKRGKSRHAR